MNAIYNAVHGDLARYLMFTHRTVEFARIVPTDCETTPKRLTNWKAFTFDGTETTWFDAIGKMWTCPDFASEHAYASDDRRVFTADYQTYRTAPEGDKRIDAVYISLPNALGRRSVSFGTRDTYATEQEWRDYLSENPITVLLPLEDAKADGSVWVASERLSDNKVGYRKLGTDEFIEVYGMDE